MEGDSGPFDIHIIDKITDNIEECDFLHADNLTIISL